MTDLADLEARLDRLEHELGCQADVQAVRKLQFTYGYMMDKCLFADIVELFAEDAELHFMGGIFRGKEGARRLYGGASLMNGPTDGMLFDHIIAQDIVTVADDRQSAKGRFRTFMQGGVHETKTDAPPMIPPQFLEAGVYENDYVREDGIWKFKIFNYRVVWQASFDTGWAHTPIEPMMVSEHASTFPENPRGPDEIEPKPPRWPHAVFIPFHFRHPVTGKIIGEAFQTSRS
jgi:hypothetical protein